MSLPHLTHIPLCSSQTFAGYLAGHLLQTQQFSRLLPNPQSSQSNAGWFAGDLPHTTHSPPLWTSQTKAFTTAIRTSFLYVFYQKVGYCYYTVFCLGKANKKPYDNSGLLHCNLDLLQCNSKLLQLGCKRGGFKVHPPVKQLENFKPPYLFF